MKSYFKILFPSEPFNIRNIDDEFKTELTTSKMFFDNYFFDLDSFEMEEKLISNIDFKDECRLIYRGWMLKPEQYKKLHSLILKKSNGGIKLMNSPMEYEQLHCFPLIYPEISEFTPKIKIVRDINMLNYDMEYDFFLKDYVKSIKTINGVEKLSKSISVNELKQKIDDFIEERGMLFTGNVIFKEFVDLKQFGDKTNEWRVFYSNGICISKHQNTYLKTEDKPSDSLINEVGGAIGTRSNFFKVDFALTESGEWIVIETGDGQVSGLCNGHELPFYVGLDNKFNKRK